MTFKIISLISIAAMAILLPVTAPAQTEHAPISAKSNAEDKGECKTGDYWICAARTRQKDRLIREGSGTTQDLTPSAFEEGGEVNLQLLGNVIKAKQFDEADSYFAKRSAANPSNENVPTAEPSRRLPTGQNNILAKSTPITEKPVIEDVPSNIQEGANTDGNIDDAFLRRFKN